MYLTVLSHYSTSTSTNSISAGRSEHKIFRVVEDAMILFSTYVPVRSIFFRERII